jgi:hypothetical protein
MSLSRWTLRVATAALAVVLAPLTTDLAAQGVTTGAVAGTISDRNGRPVEGAQVQVQNRATGYSSGALSRANGYYYVPGLEVGGPYTVRVRRIGYEASERSDVMVRLSQTTRADFQIVPAAVTLERVEVRATAEASDFGPARQGLQTTVVDSLITRMPSLQRDFTDLVRLTPQAVTQTGGQGPSAGGVYNRLNNFTVDGTNQNDRFNLGSSGGRPGGATNGRLVPVDAVKEVQVLLSPTDVRHGNFAGMVVNAVTKSGTNDFTGGATYTFRTPQMAADVDQIRTSGFKVRNFGFYVGGPIIRDKLHFFIAPEWQERTDPTTGPTLLPGATSFGTSNVQISADSIAEIQRIVGSRFDVGNAGPFSRGNPLTNLMGRLDWSINSANRFTFRVLDNTAEQDELSRNTTGLSQSGVTSQSTGIRLTSNAFTRQATNRSYATQLFTNLANGMSNELLVGYNILRDVRIVPVAAPEISVGVTPNGGTSGPSVAVTLGTERFSPGNDLKQRILEVSNNLTIPMGSAHTVTVGGRYERTYIYNYFLSGAGYGAYTFPNITALRNSAPSAYAFSYANGGDIAAEFRGQQISAFAQDLWNVTPRFSITAGVRVDIPTFLDTPGQNQMITDSAANSPRGSGVIRTDWKPKTQALWSPRLGFNWDVTGTQSTQLRGNVGIYTAQAPYILVGNAYANTGLGGVTVGCSGAQTPVFTTDVSALPRSCAGQPAPTPGAAGTVGVNITDPNFKYPQNLTTSFGVDHRFPFDIVGTFEALYRKDINPLFVRDLNLIGPRMVSSGSIYRDPHGRVLYADTFTVSGTGAITVVNDNQRRILRVGPGTGVAFSEGAIMLTNAKAGHSYSFTGQLRRRFGRVFEMTGAYTYMQARDVQSLTSDRAISNWRNGRQFSGLENDPEDATVSNFQRPHRFMGYGTWTAPWTKYQTDVTFFYELTSGQSITYVTNTDINGDGIGANDPIYIPRDATDPSEIRIGTGAGTNFRTDAATAATFERFIELQPCLDKQRGQIMARNSCQAPFTRRLDASIRQTLPRVRGQSLTAELQVFNFANLLNRRWGQDRFPVVSVFNNQQVLRGAGRQPGALSTAPWNYNMDTGLFNNIRNSDSPWSLNPNSPSNNYQLQLQLRYSF